MWLYTYLALCTWSICQYKTEATYIHEGDVTSWLTFLWKSSVAWICRSSRPEVFCKKAVLRNFAKFTGKHLCQSLLFSNVAGLTPYSEFSGPHFPAFGLNTKRYGEINPFYATDYFLYLLKSSRSFLICLLGIERLTSVKIVSRQHY